MNREVKKEFKMEEKLETIKNCGKCPWSKEQYSIYGDTNFNSVTCTKLNCGTARFEINNRCPMKEYLFIK